MKIIFKKAHGKKSATSSQGLFFFFLWPTLHHVCTPLYNLNQLLVVLLPFQVKNETLRYLYVKVVFKV